MSYSGSARHNYHLTSKGELTCFGYGKLGYYKSKYPKGPFIKEIARPNIEDNLELEEELEDLKLDRI